MAVPRPVGAVALICGVAIIGYLAAGAHGYIKQAENFVIFAGIPSVLLCSLVGTVLMVSGAVCALRRHKRDGGPSLPA